MDNPKFIQSYLDAITDDAAYTKLIALSAEYKTKIKEINNDAVNIDKNSAAYKYKNLTGKKIETSGAQKRKDLENEYKLKAIEIAEPHIEDKAKFKELAEQHGPDPEYLQELEARKEEQLRKNSDPEITASQDAMIKRLEEIQHQKDQQQEQPQQQPENTSTQEAASQENTEELTAEQKRAQKIAELNRQFAQSREMMKDKER